jgi:phosphoglucosamine mutase
MRSQPVSGKYCRASGKRAGIEEKAIAMEKLFGTDGIRGIANQDPITPEMGLRLGRAVIHLCRKTGSSSSVVIGRDPRRSGEMLECAIVSGILSMGGNAYRLGVLPTPGVAFLTRELGAGAGIMVSASHNPHEYNGFKVFSHEGFKLSDEEESEIEGLLISQTTPPAQGEPGHVEVLGDAGERYISFLRKTFPERNTLKDMKIVIDCANGATFRVAPALFERLGAQTEALFIGPNGININQNCGSQHTEALRRKVLEAGADVGLAFDGDGDRLIAVDEQGRALTGDQILVICAKMLKEIGGLESSLVVSTVMSNIGFRIALERLGIEQVSTQVGDRFVMEEMRARNAILGGEDSGHIIFLRHHTTGDGLLSALQLLFAMRLFGDSLSKLAALMTVFPQALINVPVQAKPDISEVPKVVKAIEIVKRELGSRGRVLVRYSGTEPICRVMVEGEKQEEAERYAGQIAQVIKNELNALF